MFKILLHGKPVGYASVNKEGLYYRFHCSCKLQGEEFYRIHVTDGQNRKDLGICVPKGDEFTLSARVPVKQLNGKCLQFTVVQHAHNNTMNCVPVSRESPFPYIDRLNTARFQIINGQALIVIAPVQDQPDSDQNQELRRK